MRTYEVSETLIEQLDELMPSYLGELGRSVEYEKNKMQAAAAEVAAKADSTDGGMENLMNVLDEWNMLYKKICKCLGLIEHNDCFNNFVLQLTEFSASYKLLEKQYKKSATSHINDEILIDVMKEKYAPEILKTIFQKPSSNIDDLLQVIDVGNGGIENVFSVIDNLIKKGIIDVSYSYGAWYYSIKQQYKENIGKYFENASGEKN